jgi:hypothetical protein
MYKSSNEFTPLSVAILEYLLHDTESPAESCSYSQTQRKYRKSSKKSLENLYGLCLDKEQE